MAAHIKSLDDYRRNQGAKAHAFGNLFERMFQMMCSRSMVTCTRFPDGCRSVGANRIVRVETPFDWIVTWGGKTALLDTKTTEGESFPHSKIKTHQVKEMVIHEHSGAIGGYVLWLRKPDSVHFISAVALEKRLRYPGSVEGGSMDTKLIGASSYFDVRLIFPHKELSSDPFHPVG